MTCIAAIRFGRTEAERADQDLAWNRPDHRFFASGACHILAFRFCELNPGPLHELVYVQPHGGLRGSHVYVRRGEWAFDFNGWNPEATRLSETHAACRQLVDPAWACDLISITGSLEVFCAEHNSRLPDQFTADPVPRADHYLASLPCTPPQDRPARLRRC